MPEELWPVQPINKPENNSDYCQEVSVESQPEFDLEQLIDPPRYSRIGTISRVTAYVLRFVRNLQSRCRKSSPVYRYLKIWTK